MEFVSNFRRFLKQTRLARKNEILCGLEKIVKHGVDLFPKYDLFFTC
jgi:hypothetical protein